MNGSANKTIVRVTKAAASPPAMLLAVLAAVVIVVQPAVGPVPPAAADTVPAERVLSYTSALHIAMESSPSLLRYRLNLEGSDNSLQAARARLKSRFSLSITPLDYTNTSQFDELFSTWYTQETTRSYGSLRIDQPLKWTDGTLSLTNRFSWRDSYSEYGDQTSKTYQNNLFIAFSQPIFTYNRTQLEIRSLELDLERSQLAYALQLLSLEQRVMQSFFDVYQRKKRVEIAREELANTSAGYEIMKNKVEAGLERLDDLYQAELNMANARSAVQNREVSLANGLDRLKQQLGLPLDAVITVDEDVAYKYVPVDLEQAIAHALQNRMELRELQIALNRAADDLVRTGAQNEFKGNINLAYGTIGTNEVFRDIYESPDKDRQFAIAFEIPLWDWGAKSYQMQAAQASFETTVLSYEDEKLNIELGVREAYRSLQNQVSQIEIARQNLRNSQRTYEINLEKYENGDLTAKDLDYYQNQLSQTRLGEVAALIQYKLALQDMKIRSLWDFEHDRPVLGD